VHRHNARLPGSGQSAVGGTGAGLSDHRATCVTAESWCGRAAGIDGPTWVMATYKIADCTRYIPYPNVTPVTPVAQELLKSRDRPVRSGWEGTAVGFKPHCEAELQCVAGCCLVGSLTAAWATHTNVNSLDDTVSVC
jgi:hypothetical protein